MIMRIQLIVELKEDGFLPLYLPLSEAHLEESRAHLA
jgi:hypothetical protein